MYPSWLTERLNYPSERLNPATNYKFFCRELQQKKTSVLGRPTKFDVLEEKNQKKDEKLQQAQKDAEEMARFVRETEQHLANYRRKKSEGKKNRSRPC